MQLFFFFAASALLALAAAQSASTCPGGASQGQEVVSGAYYYKCDGGNLVPAGCLDDSSTKVPIGATFISGGSVQKTCVSDGTHLTIKCTACVSEGKVVAAGQTVDTQSVYFTCVQNGEALDLQVTGCIINGKRVAVGEKTTQDDQLLICQRTTNKEAGPVAAGCVHNGQQIDIGSQFDDQTAFYHCKKDGNAAKAQAVGCVNDGKHIYDLDIYQKGDNFYRCRVQDTTVSADLWGCALKSGSTVEPKSIACTWDTGSDPINYVNCCIKKGDQAVITQLYCLYTYRGGRIQVDEGCFRIFDKTAAGCKRQSDGTLKMDTWDASDVSNTLAAGLHQC